MNSFNPNYFIHAANVLLVVAYSVRDILWGGGGHSTARFPGLTSSQSPPGSEHWILDHP